MIGRRKINERLHDKPSNVMLLELMCLQKKEK
jgi:hypothetical protein